MKNITELLNESNSNKDVFTVHTYYRDDTSQVEAICDTKDKAENVKAFIEKYRSVDNNFSKCIILQNSINSAFLYTGADKNDSLCKSINKEINK